MEELCDKMYTLQLAGLAPEVRTVVWGRDVFFDLGGLRTPAGGESIERACMQL